MLEMQLRPTAKSAAEMVSDFCFLILFWHLWCLEFCLGTEQWRLLEHILWNSNSVQYPRPSNSSNDTFSWLSYHVLIGFIALVSAARRRKLSTAQPATYCESTYLKIITGQHWGKNRYQFGVQNWHGTLKVALLLGFFFTIKRKWNNEYKTESHYKRSGEFYLFNKKTESRRWYAV